MTDEYNTEVRSLYETLAVSVQKLLTLFHYRYLVEFRDFVSRADEALWELFQSIDRNHNGEIDRAELKEAFASAGITVSSSMLDQFLAQMDQNNDGVITYNEWR